MQNNSTPPNNLSKKELDRSAILSMSGCFKVEFKFTETFNYSTNKDYKASLPKLENATEYVHIIEDSEDCIRLQHLLIVNSEQPFIIKHWRQDWIYEETRLYKYEGNNCWEYCTLEKEEVKGQWTQKVFQVDDSPRYEGSASWVHVDGRSFWECSANAPLPRREHTKRDDYNLLVRKNRHEITENGWIHDQDNKKVIRNTDAKDLVLAEEKGVNTYVKIDLANGDVAKKWWEENGAYWKKVRAKWDEIFSMNKDLNLLESINGKNLYQLLSSDEEHRINDIVNGFVVELSSEY